MSDADLTEFIHRQLTAQGRRLDEHKIAQQFLCMVCNPDRDDAVASGLCPLVIVGISSVCGNHAC